jgi:hypothetical protein
MNEATPTHNIADDAALAEFNATQQRWHDAQTRLDEARGTDNGELGIMTIEKLSRQPRTGWQVVGRIRQQSSVLFHGPTESLKSFDAIDLMARLCLGLPWAGAETRTSGTVLYIAAEGQETIAERVDAWCVKNGIPMSDLANFHVMPKSPLLNETEPRDRLLWWVAENEPVAVVIDTFGKSMGGEFEENSNTDVNNLLVNSIDAIKMLGATVVLVHHPGYGNEDRARGASALMQGVDARFRVVRPEPDGLVNIVSCEKQKAGRKFDAFTLVLAEHEFLNEEGDTETTLAVVGHGAAPATSLRPAAELVTEFLIDFPAMYGKTDVAEKVAGNKMKNLAAVNEMLADGRLILIAVVTVMSNGRPRTKQFLSLATGVEP